MRSIGARASSRRPDGRSVYALPVISVPSHTPAQPVVLSGVAVIAEYLEEAYPARPVYPPGTKALQTLFVYYLMEVFAKPLLPLLIPVSAQRLPERSQAHFFAPGQQAGAPALTASQREQAWADARANFEFLAKVLDKNGTEEIEGDGGRGILAYGREPTYADFALCSVLIWIETVSPQEAWPRIKAWDGGRWSRLKHALRGYMDVL